MIKVFIDTSVLISGLLSTGGASFKIISFCESGTIDGYISEQVADEIRDVGKRKFPHLIDHFKNSLGIVKFKLVKNISPVLLRKASKWISDKNDVHILAAAKQANVDVLLTLDIRHFIKDSSVEKKSGLKIMTPGEFMRGFVKYL